MSDRDITQKHLAAGGTNQADCSTMPSTQSRRGFDWFNFFVADVRTGVGRLMVGRWLGQSGTSHLIQEGLQLLGWVSTWTLIEIFLYRWWPLAADRKLYEQDARPGTPAASHGNGRASAGGAAAKSAVNTTWRFHASLRGPETRQF
jgi:hypothetical protein